MIKATKFLILIAVILFSTLGMISTVYGDEMNKGIVIVNDANVRDEPKVDGKVITSMELGRYVNILERDKAWYKIIFDDGKIGWIYQDLIVMIEEKGASYKKGTVNGNNLNLREQPSINANIIKKLDHGIGVTIIDKNQDWYEIIVSEDVKGWVYGSYINVESNYPKGRITATNVNLRKIPSADGEILSSLGRDNFVEIKGYKENWYNVHTKEDKEGWVHQDYVMVLFNNDNNVPTSRSMNRAAGSTKIIAFAKNYLGTPYKWAADGPNSFDCSGFTTYIFNNFGIALPRRSSDQAKTGNGISLHDLEMADLVFFDTEGKNDGNVTHVGIYLGDGQFIHASSGSKAKKVVISSLSEGYYKEKFVIGRRIF